MAIANIPTIDPSEALSYLHFLGKTEKLRHRGFYMQGPPGCGKSAVVIQYTKERGLEYARRWEEEAKQLEANGKHKEATELAERAKTLNNMAQDPVSSGLLVYLVLSNRNPSDIEGMQFLDHEEKATITYAPDWLPNPKLKGFPITLFFDELTSVDSLLQAPTYQILQERIIGKRKLDTEIHIIAAGNGPEDAAIHHELSSAVCDRLFMTCVKTDYKKWLENYGQPNRLHPAVMAGVSSMPHLIDTNKERYDKGEMAASTARGMEDVSRLMYQFDEEKTSAMHIGLLLSMRLGNTAGAAMAAVYANSTILLNVRRILETPDLKFVDKELLPKVNDKDYESKILMMYYGFCYDLKVSDIERIMEISNLLIARGRSPDTIGSCVEFVFATALKSENSMDYINALRNSPANKAYRAERESKKLTRTAH